MAKITRITRQTISLKRTPLLSFASVKRMYDAQHMYEWEQGSYDTNVDLSKCHYWTLKDECSKKTYLVEFPKESLVEYPANVTSHLLAEYDERDVLVFDYWRSRYNARVIELKPNLLKYYDKDRPVPDKDRIYFMVYPITSVVVTRMASKKHKRYI